MAWVVAPCLDEARDQLNRRFPGRDKASDGAIGDTRHQASASSHNPDKTGSPEYRDGDASDEVRARDFDKDLRDPVTMEQVVQHWIALARAGVLWWVRYIIFNRRIWHRRDGFKTHAYTGSNPHDRHCHVNSDFTQKADTVRGTNWHLDELGKAPVTKPPATLTVDGKLGPKTIKRWQQVMGTPADGVISTPSALVRAVQRRLNSAIRAGLAVDGVGIRQDGRTVYKTTKALQRYLGTPQDGVLSLPTSAAVKALQRRLNTGRF